MRVFVATRRTQGQRPDDCSETVDGELVHFPTVSGRCPDNGPNCGCTSVMVGFGSGRLTTTFTVADMVSLDATTYRRLLFDAVVREDGDDPDAWFQVPAWAARWADEHVAVAGRYADREVLDLWDGYVRQRAASR
ncbi:MAG TPA: hypothetical protein VK875_00505 [Euzebyales bacterium]|nr:hypothetical protein [Euzebyales bacterium]